MADAGFFRGTTSEQDARFTDKQKKLIKSMKFQPSLAEKVDMEKVNLDVLKPWITKRVTELLSGIEDEVLIGYIFELLESSRHPDPKKMQIDITGFLNGKNARIFMGELWTHLHSAQVNIGGIPADFLEKKKEEIRQRKRETEIIQENLRKTLSVEADSTSMREHRHRSSKDTKEWHSHTLPLPTLSTPDINQTPAMQEQLEIRKSLVGYMTSPASVPSGRDKPGWYGEHEKHVEMAKTSSAGVLLIGDSIIQGLARYPKVWSHYFAPMKSLNFGLGGDRTQNVLWRVENGEIPLNAQTIVIHVGTNNTDRDKPKDIANGIGSIAMMFQEAKPNAKIILTGLLPRDLQPSNRRKEINKVNKYLKLLCTSGHIRNFYYLKPDKDWVLPDGTLNTSYYFHDYLHLLEEGDEKFAKSIYDIITNVYSGIKIEMSSDSEISGDEGNTTYTFERVKGQPRSVSPDSRTHSSRPSRYRSRTRSPKRSRSRSPKRSRSRSRRRSRSRSVKRHSRSPQRKRYRKDSSHGRSRRRSHSRSRSRHRSRSRSTSRTPPRKRTRRRSVSRSKSPSPPPRPVNNNLRELTKIQSPSPPPTHGRSNGNLVQLKNGETECEQRVCEESEEPVRIKPADEGLMKEDAESSTTFPRSDKLQSRTYRRRNSESDESADPEKIEPPLPALPVITTQETNLKHKEESEEEKSPTPTRKASPSTKSSPHRRRRTSRSPQRFSRRVPKKHSPSFTPSPPRRKPSPPRKRLERRHSPPRRKERRSPPRKKSPVKDSSSDRSTSPEVRKRRQLRKKREQEARGKAERERTERAERAERLERAEREKELRAKEAREKERKLAERLREKHRQRQRQKRSPSVSESESESDRETRRKKMVDAAAKRIAQASESDESEVDSGKKERTKQKSDLRNNKGEQKYNWKVKKGVSSDEAEEEDPSDKTHRKRNEYQQVIERAKKEVSSDERDKKEDSSDERVKKAESSEDAESEVEEETHPVVETINIRPKIEEYEYEEECEEETTNPRSRKPTKLNNTPPDRNKNESSSDEEEPDKSGKKHRRDAEEVYYKKARKHVSSAMKSPQKSLKRRQHSESIDESSDEDEVDKRRIIMKNAAHARLISPSPEKSKPKSRSTSPENIIEKRKFERKEESEPEEEEEEEEEEVHEEPKRIPRKADTSEEEEEEEEQAPLESEQEADTSPERERRRRKSSKKEKKHKRHKSKSKKKKSKKRKRYSDDENSEDEDSDVERQLRERALKSMRKKARHHRSDSSS